MASTYPLSNLQLYAPRSFAGLSEENNLANHFLIEPAKTKAIVAYALSNSMYNKNGTSVMDLLTQGMGNTEEIESNSYEWDLYGANERAIEIIGNLGDGGSTPGYGRSQFRVVTAEKYFSVTDVLFLDDKTMVRVQEEIYAGNGGYVHVLQLIDPGMTTYVDPTMIAAGAKISKAYSPVEELSIKGGDLNFSTPFKMRNQLTILRKNHIVSRNAATDILVMELPAIDNPRGKTTKMWFTLVEWNFMAQWGLEKDTAAIFGVHSGSSPVAGENGRPVVSGAGLRQQIAPSNIRYYNKLTFNLLDDLLTDLSYGANPNGGNKDFIAFTGKQGLRAFSDAISDKFKSLGLTIIPREGQFFGGTGNELVFKGDQWVTAAFPNGITLTVREMPMYDNLVHNRTLDPVSGRPVESLRFTIFNIGNNMKNGSNITKMVKKDSADLMWNVAGSYDPYQINGGKRDFRTQRSSGIDGFEIFGLSHEGYRLSDPTSAAELIYMLA